MTLRELGSKEGSGELRTQLLSELRRARKKKETKERKILMN